MGELVIHAVVTSPLLADRPEDQRLVGVLLDQLRTLPQAPLQLLAEGRPVTEVAHAVGYSTPSAFTVMFHAELGATPSSYFASGAGGRTAR